MVDNNGYLRVVDLGFAKQVPPAKKTWTFCGTPEYIPPEIISNSGHNIAADYWSLGILVFELLARRTPFRAKDDLAIYEGILRGIQSIQFPSKMSRKAQSIIKDRIKIAREFERPETFKIFHPKKVTLPSRSIRTIGLPKRWCWRHKKTSLVPGI